MRTQTKQNQTDSNCCITGHLLDNQELRLLQFGNSLSNVTIHKIVVWGTGVSVQEPIQHLCSKFDIIGSKQLPKMMLFFGTVFSEKEMW